MTAATKVCEVDSDIGATLALEEAGNGPRGNSDVFGRDVVICVAGYGCELRTSSNFGEEHRSQLTFEAHVATLSFPLSFRGCSAKAVVIMCAIYKLGPGVAAFRSLTQ